jgi:hypothetical protein
MLDKLKAAARTLGPKQLVAVLVVLPITFIGALVLVYAFRRYNRKQAHA